MKYCYLATVLLHASASASPTTIPHGDKHNNSIINPSFVPSVEILSPCVTLSGSEEGGKELGQICANVDIAENREKSLFRIKASIRDKECHLTELRLSNLPYATSRSMEKTKSHEFLIPLDDVETFMCGLVVGDGKIVGEAEMSCASEEDAEVEVMVYDSFSLSLRCSMDSSGAQPSRMLQDLAEGPSVMSGVTRLRQTYTMEDITYPSERLDLDDLNFCDLGWGGMTRHSFKHGGSMDCPPIWATDHDRSVTPFDPTCRGCLREDYQEAGEQIWRSYSDPVKSTSRREMYQEWFSKQVCEPDDPTCGKLAVVVGADDKYLPVLRHWWCHAERQGLHASQVIVYSFGDEVTRWGEEVGMLTVSPLLYEIDVPVHVSFTFKFSTFPVFLDLLHLGKHVLFNDVDMIWTGNMARVLPTMWPDVDLVTQMAPIENFVGLNSGVLSMRPTSEMKIFVETLMSTIPVFLAPYGRGGDQILWNHLLRHYAFRSLSWRPLPHRIITRHSLHNEFIPGTSLAVHFIGANGGKGTKISEKLSGKWGEDLSMECLELLNDSV